MCGSASFRKLRGPAKGGWEHMGRLSDTAPRNKSESTSDFLSDCFSAQDMIFLSQIKKLDLPYDFLSVIFSLRSLIFLP